MPQKKTMILSLAMLLLAFITGCSKVPDLTGMTQDDAKAALAKKNLVVGTVTTTTQPGKTAGTVVDQDPKPNAKIPDNKTVALVLQAGNAAAGTTGGTTGNTGGTTGGNNPGTVAVPDLTAQTFDAASVALVTAGLVADPPNVVINDQPPGLVFAQDPPKGTQVAPGTHVMVSVASDAMVTVPPVTGQPQAAAQQAISQAQLTPSIDPEIHPGSDAVGTVFEENPVAGLKIAKGQQVILKVKEESVTVPRVVGADQAAAQLTLFNAGVTPTIQLVFGDATNIGKVISQAVPEGTPVPRGSPVSITVGGLRFIHPVAIYNKAMVLHRVGQ